MRQGGLVNDTLSNLSVMMVYDDDAQTRLAYSRKVESQTLSSTTPRPRVELRTDRTRLRVELSEPRRLQPPGRNNLGVVRLVGILSEDCPL